MGRYVTVNISTEGLFRVGSRAYGDVGLIGRGVDAGFTTNTAYVIKNPNEAKTLFGETSALYKSTLLLFANGCNKAIVVPADVTPQTQEKFSGTGSQKEFTLASIPAQPMDSVKVGSVAKVEDTDFYVDYGNKKLIFYTAPASGTNNIEVDYSKHTAAQVEDALEVLEDEDVQLVVGALMYESTLLAKIKDHCVAMESDSARIGVYMLANGETSTTLATTLASHLSVLIAHKSLKDVAAACCGVIAKNLPQKDLTMKAVTGIEQDGKFTNTQIATFDAAHIITMYDPPKLTGNDKVFSTGWTLDGSGTMEFIDIVRTAQYIASILDYGLTNPNVIGTMRMNRTGLTQLNDYIRSLLNPQVNANVIDSYDIVSPAYELFNKKNPDSSDISNMAALQSSRRLEGAWKITIECVYSGTIIYIEINAALTGGV